MTIIDRMAGLREPKGRVLVTGSREWTDEELIRRTLIEWWESAGRPRAVLVHGAAKGADRLCAKAWEQMGLPVEAFYVNSDEWRQRRDAGHQRNQRMVDSGADICFAFPTGSSVGTWDCVRRARKARIPVRVIRQH